MKHNILLAILLVVSMASTQAQTLDGDWTGKLELGGGRNLKLVLHITESPATVTMDSPDQGAYGLACETEYLNGDSISIKIPSLMMSYGGRVKDGTLSGLFQQGFVKLPLSFSPGIKKANRPQTPQPPFPYKEEEVKITNTDGGCVLAGTLTTPQNCVSSTPVAILVSGSGSQNRDEELFEHKPFAVIADYLARNGVASLRYDDRGFGESTGDRANATTKDYASDTKAIVDWLRDQNRFGKIGVIGHSEGGMIAYILGASNDKPDFIVSIAGPSIVGSKILDYQNKIALTNSGYTEDKAEELAINARKRLEADSTMKWMQYFLQYDPAPDLQNLTIPTLIIYGEKDQQVPPSLNYEPAKQLAPRAIVRLYPNLNHMMQHAQTGKVEEYSAIEETISPEVLSDILSFIKEQE